MKNNKLVNDEKSRHFKIIYRFNAQEIEAIDELDKKIKEALNEFGYRSLSVSQDVYNRNELFVVIHGFTTKLAAVSFEDTLRNSPRYLIENDYVVLSSENYQIVQIHKNLNEVN